jgi:hypothetical protein
MKLAHAVFVYPRLEVPYVREWLDYHEAMGVDHVYMTLHLNEPRDRPLPRERIVWQKKPKVPYIMGGTENDTVDALMINIKDHIDRKRITIRTATRKQDSTGISHRPDQVRAYQWAAKQLRDRHDPNWSWLVVNDIDEFMVPIVQHHNLKQVIARELERQPRASALRCRCVIHPSRYDGPTLAWNTYTPVAGQQHCVSKYICDIRRTGALQIHMAKPLPGYLTVMEPCFYVHHFRGFDKYALVKFGWPTPAHKQYVTKPSNEPFVIRHTL